MKKSILLISLFFIFNSFAEKFCKEADIKTDLKCMVGLDDVHPTQFTLGMISIKKKVKKIEKNYKKKNSS